MMAKISVSIADPIVAVSVDIPLFIRLLEFAREDAGADLPLHYLAEHVEKLSREKGRPLTVSDYDQLVANTKAASAEA